MTSDEGPRGQVVCIHGSMGSGSGLKGSSRFLIETRIYPTETQSLNSKIPSPKPPPCPEPYARNRGTGSDENHESLTLGLGAGSSTLKGRLGAPDLLRWFVGILLRVARIGSRPQML